MDDIRGGVGDVLGNTGDVRGGLGDVPGGADNVRADAGPLLVREPNALGACSFRLRPDASARIKRLNASKSFIQNE